MQSRQSRKSMRHQQSPCCKDAPCEIKDLGTFFFPNNSKIGIVTLKNTKFVTASDSDYEVDAI